MAFLPKHNFIEELRWRGMLHDMIPGLEAQLQSELTSAYIGFDPTAASLHIGNLATIMLLKQFQLAGHKPFALVGGATGMIGDPSGKSAEREFLSEEILSISGKKDNFKWIGIAPFAQYESKVYPLDLMQNVVDNLALKSNTKIFLFGGGKEETEKLNTLAKQRENIVVVAGKLKFNQELQLISNLDIMLSMDSGNAHIAAMLGIKVITLWGATHPFAGFAPFNQPLENYLTADRNQYPLLPTSVYGNKKVAGYEEVMRSISVESIVEKINLELNH